MFITNVGGGAGFFPSPERNRMQPVEAAVPAGGRPLPGNEGASSASLNVADAGRFPERRLQFVVDYATNDVVVRVIDKKTDEVVRELPPEELQRLQRNRGAEGSLLNERV